ncbi:integrating conjugative element protein pill, pfgi-1 [Ventosimonas gracilis]|uniref:Integrating conjugative element protein pill, pfgi-1 n=1 Tax=Ventosimonas gracilis TaxID=1680762 RepID=A0A139SUR0_9GAMM|nr:PilL N-terminal domain-containing protein [Ventosimonas gracilis]KXU38338.1 integrating conjugative element protein pill, pfgi-1 [Ventosimonas gracilis]
MPAISVPHAWIAASLLTTAFVSGCATQTVPSTPVVEQTVPATEPEESIFVPVVRSGRYTLVELEPTAAQRDLLLQVVEVSLPQGVQATVGDGLRHVLKRTGWRLCEGTAAAMELDALPLPVAHLHLGPMTVRNALLTLAGSAWELRTDERARQVCFVVHEDLPDNTPDADDESSADQAIQSFPLREAQP